MTIKAIRKYPISEIYLDGKLIVKYYDEQDRRNIGSCEISTNVGLPGMSGFALVAVADREPETVLRYSGEEIPVDYVIAIKNKGQTWVHKLTRKENAHTSERP